MTVAAIALPPARPRRVNWVTVTLYAINIVVALLFLVPWLLAIGISLTPQNALRTYPPTLFPWPIDISAYTTLMTVDDGKFLNYMRTSAIVAGATSVCVVMVSAMAGYALSKLRFVGREWFFIAILATMMFPFTTVLIPLFSMMSQLRLINNPLSLIILYTVLQAPFCTYLFRNSFNAIPDEVRDAGLIDGASESALLRRIMVPLAMPAVATVLIYSLYQSWNEFTIALIFLTDDATTTVPVGLVTLSTAGRFGSFPNIQMAGAVLSFLPVLVLFLLFQRFFVAGIISGSTKG